MGAFHLLLRMDPAHSEALRAAERVLDHQVALVLAGHRDLERLMRLGVASLAGTLAGTGLLLQVGLPFPTAAVVGLAAGVLLQAVGTAAASGVGLPSDLVLGPEPIDLYRSVSEDAPSVQDVCIALLEQAALGHRRNRRTLERIGRHRQAAVVLLFSGAGAALASIGYVVGGGILA